VGESRVEIGAPLFGIGVHGQPDVLDGSRRDGFYYPESPTDSLSGSMSNQYPVFKQYRNHHVAMRWC